MLPMLKGVAWNALLAVIPLAAAWAFARLARRVERSGGLRDRVGLGALAIVWLAFLPNTCYLMTEWRHFLFDGHFRAWRERVDPNSIAVVRIAVQAACFALYSGFGVACFALAIRPVGEVLRRWGQKPVYWAAPFFFLTSLGVYLGLIVRLNSWDLAVRPGYVARIAAGAVARPPLLTVLLAFALMLWALYLAVDVWLTGLQVRLSRSRAIRALPDAEKYRVVPR